MKFLFIINKWANFYFFLQNLSNWNIFLVRKRYNLVWRKELKLFSQNEENALKKFKKIHLKYPLGNLYLGHYFLTQKNPWKILEKKLTKKDFDDLKKIFFVWKEKFRIFYKKEFPLLKKWQKVLKSEFSNKKLINTINDVLARLYNVSFLSKNLNKVYLLPTVNNKGCGKGWTSKINDNKIKNNSAILLEISRCPLKEKSHILGIVWHEVIHLCYEKKYFLPLLQKKFPKNPKMIDLIKEATNSSLFSSWNFSKKIFKF